MEDLESRIGACIPRSEIRYYTSKEKAQAKDYRMITIIDGALQLQPALATPASETLLLPARVSNDRTCRYVGR